MDIQTKLKRSVLNWRWWIAFFVVIPVCAVLLVVEAVEAVTKQVNTILEGVARSVMGWARAGWVSK